jgi:hypothetical protein
MFEVVQALPAATASLEDAAGSEIHGRNNVSDAIEQAIKELCASCFFAAGIMESSAAGVSVTPGSFDTPNARPGSSGGTLLRDCSESHGKLWNCMLLVLPVVLNLLGLDEKCKH